MSALPPLRRQVVVPAGAQVAFDVFTQRIGGWWPVAKFSVYGPDARGEVAELLREAYEEDGGVTNGVLEVRVRPWAVMFAG
jgi:hypothetical protein